MDDLERKLQLLGEMAVEPRTVPTARIARRARMRKAVASLATTGMVLVLAFGGYAGVRALGTGPTTASRSVLTTAAAATEDEGTARAALDMEMHGSGGVFSFDSTVHGVGEVDFARNRSHMTFETEESPSGAQATELIQDGTVLYQKGLTSDPSGKWVKTGGAEDDGDPASTALQSGNDLSPGDYLDYLDAVSNEIEVVGLEELDGVSVTHYKATIDEERYLADIARSSASDGAGLGADDVVLDPAEVWVDSAHRVRKLTFGILTATPGQSGVSIDMDFSMLFYDFGVPVDIRIPGPDEIADPSAADDESPSDGEFAFEADPTPSVVGSLDVTFVSGADGLEAPYLTLLRSPRAGTSLCVNGDPSWARGARVVAEHTGDVVAAIPKSAFAEVSSGDGGACTEFTDRDRLDGLVSAPSDYALEVFGGDDHRLSIPLVSADDMG